MLNGKTRSKPGSPTSAFRPPKFPIRSVPSTVVHGGLQGNGILTPAAVGGTVAGAPYVMPGFNQPYSNQTGGAHILPSPPGFDALGGNSYMYPGPNGHHFAAPSPQQHYAAASSLYQHPAAPHSQSTGSLSGESGLNTPSSDASGLHSVKVQSSKTPPDAMYGSNNACAYSEYEYGSFRSTSDLENSPARSTPATTDASNTASNSTKTSPNKPAKLIICARSTEEQCYTTEEMRSLRGETAFAPSNIIDWVIKEVYPHCKGVVIPSHLQLLTSAPASIMSDDRGGLGTFARAPCTKLAMQRKDREIHHKVMSVLSRVTPEKYDALRQELLDLPLRQTTELQLKQIVEVFFEKAVQEPVFSPTYARLVADVCCIKDIDQEKLAQDRDKLIAYRMRRELLSKCQSEFEKPFILTEADLIASVDATAHQPSVRSASSPMAPSSILPVAPPPQRLSEQEIEFKQSKLKRRLCGNVKFVCELYKLNLVTDRVIDNILGSLCGCNKREDYVIEGFATTLKAAGGRFEVAQPEKIERYMKFVKEVEATHALTRVKFMMMDLADLRKKGWNNDKENSVMSCKDLSRKKYEEQKKEQEELEECIRQNSSPMNFNSPMGKRQGSQTAAYSPNVFSSRGSTPSGPIPYDNAGGRPPPQQMQQASPTHQQPPPSFASAAMTSPNKQLFKAHGDGRNSVPSYSSSNGSFPMVNSPVTEAPSHGNLPPPPSALISPSKATTVPSSLNPNGQFQVGSTHLPCAMLSRPADLVTELMGMMLSSRASIPEVANCLRSTLLTSKDRMAVIREWLRHVVCSTRMFREREQFPLLVQQLLQTNGGSNSFLTVAEWQLLCSHWLMATVLDGQHDDCPRMFSLWGGITDAVASMRLAANPAIASVLHLGYHQLLARELIQHSGSCFILTFTDQVYATAERSFEQNMNLYFELRNPQFSSMIRQLKVMNGRRESKNGGRGVSSRGGAKPAVDEKWLNLANKFLESMVSKKKLDDSRLGLENLLLRYSVLYHVCYPPIYSTCPTENGPERTPVENLTQLLNTYPKLKDDPELVLFKTVAASGSDSSIGSLNASFPRGQSSDLETSPVLAEGSRGSTPTTPIDQEGTLGHHVGMFSSNSIASFDSAPPSPIQGGSGTPSVKANHHHYHKEIAILEKVLNPSSAASPTSNTSSNSNTTNDAIMTMSPLVGLVKCASAAIALRMVYATPTSSKLSAATISPLKISCRQDEILFRAHQMLISSFQKATLAIIRSAGLVDQLHHLDEKYVGSKNKTSQTPPHHEGAALSEVTIMVEKWCGFFILFEMVQQVSGAMASLCTLGSSAPSVRIASVPLLKQLFDLVLTPLPKSSLLYNNNNTTATNHQGSNSAMAPPLISKSSILLLAKVMDVTYCPASPMQAHNGTTGGSAPSTFPPSPIEAIAEAQKISSEGKGMDGGDFTRSYFPLLFGANSSERGQNPLHTEHQYRAIVTEILYLYYQQPDMTRQQRHNNSRAQTTPNTNTSTTPVDNESERTLNCSRETIMMGHQHNGGNGQSGGTGCPTQCAAEVTPPTPDISEKSDEVANLLLSPSSSTDVPKTVG